MIVAARAVDRHAEKRLRRRFRQAQGIFVENVSARGFCSAAELGTALQQALVRRRTNETLMNNRSSRSHFITTVEIETRTRLDCPDPGQTEARVLFEVTKRAKIIFIDLAGSERQALNSNEILQEGCAINKSLSVLQHVLASIGKKRSGEYVHYRDSK